MTLPKQLYPELEKESALFWMITVSVAFHVAVFIGAVAFPKLNSNSHPFTPVYTVELVNLPPAAPNMGTQVTQQSSDPSEDVKKSGIHLPEKAPRMLVPAEEVETKPIPIVKKKRAFKIKVKEVPADKRIERQITRLKREEETTKTLDNAIKRVQQTVASAKTAEKQSNTPPPGSPSGAAGSSRGIRSGGQVGLRLQIYKTRIWNKVRSNWSYPEILASQRNAEAVVLVSVTRDGRIMNYRLTKKSGNSLFDQSVIRAVKLSEPFPPFPEGYVKRQDELELRFSLAELTNNS